MKIVIIIACIIAAILLYAYLFSKFNEWVGDKACYTPPPKVKYSGLRTFNLPFMPEEKEVFYVENEYDEKANRFIKENKDYIIELFAKKGFTFVYLPDIKVSRELAETTIAYHSPDSKAIEPLQNEESQLTGLRSNFLLDYMINPHNRKDIKSSFAWYNSCWPLTTLEKNCYLFNLATFDADDALANPNEIIAEVFSQLGKKLDHSGRMYQRSKKVEKDATDTADDNFDNEEALDNETRQMLDDVRTRLDKIRLRGIREAVIAKYLKPTPKLSHLTITYDLRIILDDYDGMEIKMEPIVKTTYLFFLRHPKGVFFKFLPQYRNEMEIIYHAVKDKRNYIDKAMEANMQLKISPSVEALCNPTKNSINEKCSRIKEVFIIHFDETIASHYYISGMSGGKKMIMLPRDLVKWEEKK